MEFPKMDINIETEEHNFIIEEKKVSKIYLVYPFFFFGVSSKLSEHDGKLVLHMYDQLASSCLRNIDYLYRFYTLNPISKTFRIIVPENSLCNLNVNLENGNLFLKRVNLQDVKISCLRGNINIFDSCFDKSLINGYESDIYIRNLAGRDCFAATRTGNLTLEGTMPTSTTLKTILGNIKLSLEDYSLKHTLVNIDSKRVKCLLEPTQETQKVIRCVASYGHVNSNVF